MRLISSLGYVEGVTPGGGIFFPCVPCLGHVVVLMSTSSTRSSVFLPRFYFMITDVYIANVNRTLDQKPSQCCRHAPKVIALPAVKKVLCFYRRHSRLDYVLSLTSGLPTVLANAWSSRRPSWVDSHRRRQLARSLPAKTPLCFFSD